jgi:hypothetical protein
VIDLISSKLPILKNIALIRSKAPIVEIHEATRDEILGICWSAANGKREALRNIG